MNFKDIVQKYSDPDRAPLGGEPSRVLDPNERQQLRSDLELAIARNRGGYLTAIALIVCLFIINICVVLLKFDEPSTAQAATGAIGVSAAGLITWMTRLWSDKSRLEMLAVFAVNLEGDALKTLLNVLVAAQGTKS